jgi:hypothetical protein
MEENMSRKGFRLLSVIFALALLAGCVPVTPITLPTHTPTKTQDYHDNVVDFSLSPDGRILVINTQLHTLILNAEAKSIIKTLPIAHGISKFSSDGKVLYLSGHNSSSLLLNTKNWEAATPYDHDWEYFRFGPRVQISPNNQTFAFDSGGVPNECDGAHRAFEIRQLYTDKVLYRQINCAPWVHIIFKYSAEGDHLFLGYEAANYENDQSAPNLLVIIDAENGSTIRKFSVTKPVEFIEDDLGVVYLRRVSEPQFLLWNLDTENYAGTSKTAKLKLDGNLFLSISLEDTSYVTNTENSSTCKIGKMYGGQYEQESPIVFQFEQANGRLAYFNFMLEELFYWDISNCELINTIKLSDIANH